MDELLKIAAADKRKELKVFSTEVVRFGNRCKDPQWHNLDRYFDKLASEWTPQYHLKEEAESVMQQLVTCVQCTAVFRSSSIPPNARDSLYQNLPPTIKSALRSKLHYFGVKEELTVSQIKEEMENTLWWLVPIANNTTKAHHGFGWVGEWANTGSDVNCKPTGQIDLTRIETLHHADKDKTEAHILELVVLLHHLISQSRAANGERSPIKSQVRSPTQRGPTITLSPNNTNNSSPLLTQEDQAMLRDVKYRKFIPSISKSQEFDTKSRHNKQSRLSKSYSHSPSSSNKKELLSIRRLLPVIDFEIDRTKALYVIDRVDNLKIQ